MCAQIDRCNSLHNSDWHCSSSPDSGGKPACACGVAKADCNRVPGLLLPSSPSLSLGCSGNGGTATSGAKAVSERATRGTLRLGEVVVCWHSSHALEPEQQRPMHGNPRRDATFCDNISVILQRQQVFATLQIFTCLHLMYKISRDDPTQARA